jgi:hypothetical protein
MDDELDLSYEGLTALSARIGLVRPLGVSAAVLASLQSGRYGEFVQGALTGGKTLEEIDSRCAVCYDEVRLSLSLCISDVFPMVRRGRPTQRLPFSPPPPPTLFQYAAEDVTLSMNACSHFFHEPCLKVRSPSSCADPMPSHELQLNVPASLPLFAPLGMALFAQHLPDLPIPMQVPRFRRSRRGAYGGGGHRGHARRGRVRAALGRRLNRQGSTSSREWSSGLGVSEVAMRLSLSFLYYILFFFLARLIPRFLSVRTRYLRSVVV